MKRSQRVYERLTQAFPHEFKLAHGDEMLETGEAAIAHLAKRGGWIGLARLLADAAVRLPVEYLTEMRRDLQYAMGALIRSPGFALVGILSMGLAIGLTTNVYSSNWALLTRPMQGVAHASRLVMAEKPVSYFYVERYREQKNVFAGVAAFQTRVPFNVRLPGQTDGKQERIFGQLVSPDYFQVMGVDAERGRVLNPAIDHAGDAPAAVISDTFWHTRLGSRTDAVGLVLRVNGQAVTIVGITPRGFEGAFAAESAAELFVPVTAPAAVAPELANDILHRRNAREFFTLAFLGPGVTPAQAESALDGVTRRLDLNDPSAPPQTDKGRRIRLLPAGTRVPIPPELKRALEGFFGVLMGIVIVIACMNLGTMLMVRGANRRKEFAIRMSIGASRFRLARQLISEGMLLSLLGGLLGFGLAYLLNVLNAQLHQAVDTPGLPDVAIDWRAAVFAFVAALVCGVGLSVAPALRATKSELTPALKEGSAMQLPGHRRFGLRNLAMAAQLAGSLMLLLITGFVLMGFVRGYQVQTNFDPKTMAMASIDPVRDGETLEKALDLFAALPQRLKESGKFSSIALTTLPPFSTVDDDDSEQLIVDDPQAAQRVQQPAIKESVGAGYFRALDEPMLFGREFSDADERSLMEPTPDNAARTSPVVINETAANKLFGSTNAIGKHLKNGSRSYEVVGVVHDLKSGIGIKQAIAYVALSRDDFARPPAGGITIMVRTKPGVDGAAAIREVVSDLDPKLVPFHVETLSDQLAISRREIRSAMRTYGGIGGFGLILSAIGLAGITAYAVAQRKREIGIRMALGANKGQVLRLVLREGIALIAVGTMLGFAGAVIVSKALEAATSVLADALAMGTNDPRLLVGAPALLAALALVACYIPARAAVRIDPLKALRTE
ncbi:MAG TPA: FtsX-like permease family protein [Terracidiphilus sp.]|nr:FtsX-like permease family protein [Terracidiphilus sp.]